MKRSKAGTVDSRILQFIKLSPGWLVRISHEIASEQQASPVMALLARRLELNPDSAVEREVMGKERTWSSEDTRVFSFKVFFSAWLAPSFALRGYATH
jgi:hypothetical protein